MLKQFLINKFITLDTPLKYLMIAVISMIPLIELRGAVPIAIGIDLPIFWSYVICIIANMVPVPLIYFFARRILLWGKDKKLTKKLFTFCLEKGEKGGKKLQNDTKGGVYVALFIFVGIPLPGTGAWTGTLAASMLDLDFKKSCVAIMAGVVLAGIIMGLLSTFLFNIVGI